MKTSEAGLEFLKQQEGSRKEMYRDFIGLPTIGVGHLLTKDELSSGKMSIGGEWVDWHQGLSDQYTLGLLRQDVGHVETALNADAIVLTQHQFDALISFVFNVGIGAFARSTLRKKLLLGDLAAVPAELARWTYAGGVISPILAKRRVAETQLWHQLMVNA